MDTKITKVGIVGAGTMGAGIAQVCAQAGFDTVLADVKIDYCLAGLERIDANLIRSVSKGRITDEERKAIIGNIRATDDLGDFNDRDLVIEAIIESEEAKLSLFADLDEITPPHCYLASNTSSIPIITLAAATTRPGMVLGMHFFNPAPVQPLVEVISCLATTPETMETVEAFAAGGLGKEVITTNDRAGFIVNRLLVPYLVSAINMLDRGQASREDIDTGMRAGCGHPMGPLELCDLIGLDVVKSVADVLYHEFREPTYAVPPLLARMVAAKTLGRKTGSGFYNYAN